MFVESRPCPVLWQYKSPWLREALRAGRPPAGARGGRAYDWEALSLLVERFGATLDERLLRRPGEGTFSHVWRVRRARREAAVVVRDPFLTAFGPVAGPGARVSVLHHFDYDAERTSLRGRFYFRRLRAGLRAADVVVTVSEYWERELRAMGCRDVRVIRNSFDPSAFRFDEPGFRDLRARYALPAGRPLVYIGNARREKGVADVAAALRDEPYTLVMTGPSGADVPDLPGVRHLDLPYTDYVRLLATSDAVVTMSRMVEGWCRTAHEAMLCGTPVIGSGTGGMRELLEGGGQLVLPDVRDLPGALRAVFGRRRELGAAGRAFAARFDPAYFREAWTELVGGLLPAGDPASAIAAHRPI